MKAVVFNKYGNNEVMEIRDMPMPAPGPGDVLVRVQAASINPVDWKMRSGMLRIFTGNAFPKILGRECAGEVVECGSGATRFKKDDPVIALPLVRSMGAFAEYVSVPERTTFLRLPEISFEQAACIPIAGVTALQALRDKGQVAYGKKVLVNGASGGVGHFAVQIAKLFGAEVTAVCSATNAAFVRGLGADRVIDYTAQDFTREDYRYDIVFDAVAKSSFGECKKVLSAIGVYVSTLPSFSALLNRYVTGYFTRRKAQVIMVHVNAGDMAWMQDQIVSGRIKIVIDKTYSLDRAKEALAYSETGKVRGKIVLKIGS